MNNKKRRGISLITLIITIVVVIILAAVVIISLTKNNSVDDSKIASILQNRNAMQDSIVLYVTKNTTDTLGRLMSKEIITTNDSTEIIDNSVPARDVVKDGKSIRLYKVDKTEYKDKLKIEVGEKPSTNSYWYVDELGHVYLLYEYITDVPKYMKENDTTISKNLESFVIVLGGGASEPEVELNVGDTVNYTPVTDNSFTIPSYPSLTSGTGGVSVDTDEANANYLTWKVWKKEGNNYLITPTTPTAKKIKLYGANGYNNAVQALNAYCRKYYSDVSNGVEARSIKIEDLEGAMATAGQTAKTNYSGYNTTITPSNNSKYPLAYGEEIKTEGAKGLSEAPESDQYGVWSGNATSTSGKSGGYKKTYYYFSNSDINNATTPYYDETTRSLMFSSTGYGSGFWVASRCVNGSSGYADFRVRAVDSDGGLHGYGMFNLYDDSYGDTFALRPVVSISSSQIQKYITTGE